MSIMIAYLSLKMLFWSITIMFYAIFKIIIIISMEEPRKILFSEHFIDLTLKDTERLNTVLDETY